MAEVFVAAAVAAVESVEVVVAAFVLSLVALLGGSGSSGSSSSASPFDLFGTGGQVALFGLDEARPIVRRNGMRTRPRSFLQLQRIRDHIKNRRSRFSRKRYVLLLQVLKIFDAFVKAAKWMYVHGNSLCHAKVCSKG